METESRGASTLIPNDDPRCRCAIEGGTAEPCGNAITITGGNGTGQMATIYFDPECPLHGGFVRQVASSTLGAVSISRSG